VAAEDAVTPTQEVLDADDDSIYYDKLSGLRQGNKTKGQDHQKRIRRVVSMWVAMRAIEPNLSIREAADRLNIGNSTLHTYLRQAAREKWLQFHDPIERLEHEIIPGVVDNLAEFVRQKDRTVTLETAKGTIFRQYQAEKGAGDTQQTVLALKIDLVPSDGPQILEGHVVGKPKLLQSTHES